VRHAVLVLIKSSLNPLEPMSLRTFNQPDDVKTTGKSLILTVRKQKMRSGATYPCLLQLGNSPNMRAVIVLAPISDLNEDQL